MTVINLWSRRQDLCGVSPETMVYTLELKDDEFEKPLLCDFAWTSPEERRQHFWHKQKLKCRYLKMTLKRYVKRHVREVHAMNPIVSINRFEWLATNKHLVDAPIRPASS